MSKQINIDDLDIVSQVKIYKEALDIAARYCTNSPMYGPIDDQLTEQLIEGLKKYWIRDILIAMYPGNNVVC